MVSVCPIKAEDNQKVSELIEKAEITKSDMQEIKELLEAIPNFSYGPKGLRSVLLSDTSLIEAKKLTFTDLRTLALHLALSCADIFHSCRFKNKSVECCDEFLPVYSENGFCYSFNARTYGTARDEYDHVSLKF